MLRPGFLLLQTFWATGTRTRLSNSPTLGSLRSLAPSSQCFAMNLLDFRHFALASASNPGYASFSNRGCPCPGPFVESKGCAQGRGLIQIPLPHALSNQVEIWLIWMLTPKPHAHRRVRVQRSASSTLPAPAARAAHRQRYATHGCSGPSSLRRIAQDFRAIASDSAHLPSSPRIILRLRRESAASNVRSRTISP
jgi:hypothetical protein